MAIFRVKRWQFLCNQAVVPVLAQTKMGNTPVGQNVGNCEMINEFKAFIMRGNVLDLAVAVVIGAAFTAIVSSLVDNLITPLIGLIMGGLDFSAIGFSVGEARFGIGNFIQAVIYFVIVAFVVFMIVKAVNRMLPKKVEAPVTPPGPTAEQLLAEIRDALKAR